MIKHTEVMKLALEALEKYCTPYQDGTHPADDAITALREALTSVPDWASEAIEQPAPVQHFDHTVAANSALRDAQNRSYQIAKCKYPKCSYPCTDLPDCRDADQPAQQPAPAAKPRKQEPVKWSSYEPDGTHHNKPAQSKQKPVAWLKAIDTPGGWGKFVEAKPNEKGARPVYTSPQAQPAQPLHDFSPIFGNTKENT